MECQMQSVIANLFTNWFANWIYFQFHKELSFVLMS